jgi:hypothetical protein
VRLGERRHLRGLLEAVKVLVVRGRAEEAVGAGRPPLRALHELVGRVGGVPPPEDVGVERSQVGAQVDLEGAAARRDRIGQRRHLQEWQRVVVDRQVAEPHAVAVVEEHAGARVEPQRDAAPVELKVARVREHERDVVEEVLANSVRRGEAGRAGRDRRVEGAGESERVG